MGLRFRAEFVNIFNHPNFGNPNNTLNGPCSAAQRKCWRAAWAPAALMAATLTKSAAPAPSSSPSNSDSDRGRRYRTQSKLLTIIIDKLYQCVIVVRLNRHDSCRFCDHAFPPRGPSSFVKITSHSPITFLQTHRSRNPLGCNTYKRVCER
jgi:hypothetical protein